MRIGQLTLVITCDRQFLPSVENATNFESYQNEILGTAIGSMDDIGSKLIVSPRGDDEGYVDPGRSQGDTTEGFIKNPRYVATIWNPSKTKIWCGIFQGIFVRKEECDRKDGMLFCKGTYSK